MTPSSTLINSSSLANLSLTPVVPAYIDRWTKLYSPLTVSGIRNSIYKDTLYKNKHVIRNIIPDSFNENDEPQHEILCCYCTARWAPYSPRYYLVRAQTYHIAKIHSNTPIGKEQLILIDKMSEALAVRRSRSNRKRGMQFILSCNYKSPSDKLTILQQLLLKRRQLRQNIRNESSMRKDI